MNQQAMDWMLKSLAQAEGYAGDDAVVLVSIEQQKLYLLHDMAVSYEYPISSSKFGVGCQQGSYCTPTGPHRIAEKIGADCKYGEILQARISTGQVANIITEPDPLNTRADVITSRILWLAGLKDGVNQGGEVDSFERYIYIHGTAEESLIGQPASIGCIRMKNDDVIELFENVNVGTLVLIQ